MKVGEYEYVPYGNAFRIYICTSREGSHTGCIPVQSEPFYFDREEARKRVYELNGWKYEPRT